MRFRTAPIAIVLTGIASLITALVIESAATSRRQVATTRQVLMDYAAIGSEGAALRLQSVLAGRLYGIVNSIGDSLPANRTALQHLLKSGPTLLTDSIDYVGAIGRDGRLHVVRYTSDTTANINIANTLFATAARLPASAYMATAIVGTELIVFSMPRVGVATGVFAVPVTALHTLVQRFIEGDAILPASLTHGNTLGDGVEAVVTVNGIQLARRGNAASSPFVDTHQIGTPFSDMTLSVRLAESIAPLLIVGGIPPSRTPFLVVIVTVAIVLSVVAILQLRQRERLARLREDFVSGTSHELRTPLAQIRLFAETLRLGRVRTDDERVHALAVIEREARRLENLVDNLLHFAAQAGSVPPKLSRTNVGALTREVVTEFAPLAAKSSVTMSVEHIEDQHAIVDATAWRQIVLNLLDNAVKYGGANSRVSITLVAAASSITLSVSDTGPGVSHSDREAVWNKFWRADSARMAGITGAGIGLSTVRELTQALDGRCWVDDASPNGARFHVQLPSVA